MKAEPRGSSMKPGCRRRGRRAAQRVPRIGLAIIVALTAGSPGCSSPSYVCHVRGKITLADGKYVSRGGLEPTSYSVPGERCSVELHMDDVGGTAAAAIVLAEGANFDFPVTMPVLEPRHRWHAVFRCEGYRSAATPQFTLGEGWSTCRPVLLRSVQLEPDESARPTGRP